MYPFENQRAIFEGLAKVIAPAMMGGVAASGAAAGGPRRQAPDEKRADARKKLGFKTNARLGNWTILYFLLRKLYRITVGVQQQNQALISGTNVNKTPKLWIPSKEVFCGTI